MRKLIDIEPEILKELKILAAKADKPVKHYIEAIVKEHVRKMRSTAQQKST